jgi:hypothetical protein
MIHVLKMSICGPNGRPIAYKRDEIQWWLTHVSSSDILHFGMCSMSCNECLMDGSNPLEKLHYCASVVQLQDTCLCCNVLWCATLFYGLALFRFELTPHCWNESYN